jgi:DNA-binding XRE family transcriptional regulator
MGPRKCRSMPLSVAIGCADTTARLPQMAATRLRAARYSAGMTQAQAAALAGCDLRTVQRRELGEVDLGALEQLIVLEQVAKAKDAA